MQISLRSPQTNSAFQKLFGLPSEEFLINDFTCQLKRRMPMQVLFHLMSWLYYIGMVKMKFWNLLIFILIRI